MYTVQEFTVKLCIFELRQAGLWGSDNVFESALLLAGQVLGIRLEHQSGWASIDGEPQEWYEVGDARRTIEDLRLLASFAP